MDAAISIAVPTYCREEVLLQTLEHLFALEPAPREILVIDQTPAHGAETRQSLEQWSGSGRIRWIFQPEPSIVRAMNRALLEAQSQVVLYLDDDLIPARDLLRWHGAGYADESVWAVAGQVLQPGERSAEAAAGERRSGFRADLDFPFFSSRPVFVRNVMAGNLSVRRDRALEIGGFDENFVGVAYRFESDFARRVGKRGGKILFQPRASIRHLKAEKGGTRSAGSHLTSASPAHGVGDYYFALRQGLSPATLGYILRRPFREVRTRFHLRHPWWIPVKLVGELRAVTLAVRLHRRGPKYLDLPASSAGGAGDAERGGSEPGRRS